MLPPFKKCLMASTVLMVVFLVKANNNAIAEPGGAVVQVIASVAPTDVFEPWKRLSAQTATGSGFILPDGRILTNAHIVQDAIDVRVKQDGSTRTFEAVVSHIQPQVDLALLSVNDSGFNPGKHSIELGDLPRPQSSVKALGYPIGGRRLSTTSGVISRIELGIVSHSLEQYLLIQTDAALNPGNSGGPLISNGVCVGVNTMSHHSAENIGYAIPVPVIKQFLDDVEDGRVDGVPRLGAILGQVSNPSKLRWLNIPDDVEGGLVNYLVEGSSASGVLKRNDLVTHINGKRIDRELMVEGPHGLRIEFSHEVQLCQVGDKVSIEFYRDGNLHTAEISVDKYPMLVAPLNSHEKAHYLVYGGALFQPLTLDYLFLFSDGNWPPHLELPWYDDHQRTASCKELVVLNRVLPHSINIGYGEMEDLLVNAVNGVEPVDFAHFVHLTTNNREPFLVIRFHTEEEMVFERSEVARTKDQLLAMHGVPADRFMKEEEKTMAAR